MRVILALIGLGLLSSGCRSRSCPDLGAAMGPAKGARWLQLDVYAPPATCGTDGRPVTGGAAPRVSVKYRPEAPAAVDLPAGLAIASLRAFSDEGATTVVGEACAEVTIGANDTTCLPLRLLARDAAAPVDSAEPGDGAGASDLSQPVDAGGSAGDLAMSGPVDLGGMPDLSMPPDLAKGCMPIVHQAGVNGVTYLDCKPIGAVDALLAAEACLAVSGAACADTGCSGGNAGRAMCAHPGGGSCSCWAYSGPEAGHVHVGVGGGGCSCGTIADPSWN